MLSAAQVQDAVIDDAGARPWDRDHDDARIVADTIEGRGRIIDSQKDVNGYPQVKEAHQPFDPADWDLDTMTLEETVAAARASTLIRAGYAIAAALAVAALWASRRTTDTPFARQSHCCRSRDSRPPTGRSGAGRRAYEWWSWRAHRARNDVGSRRRKVR